MRPIRYSTGDRVIRVDPDAINPFSEVDDNPRAYRNQPSKGRIPGFGERKDTCGEPDTHFCSDCGRPLKDENGDYIEIGRTCWNKDCPRCAAGWAMRRSYTVTSKIEDYRKHKSSQRSGKSPKFHHIAIVAPYKNGESTFATNTDDPLKSLYDICKIILDQFGVFGGVMAYHPYSGTNEDDLGAWKERLFQYRDWDGDVRDELDFRPHMHAIVVADYFDISMVEAIHNQTGFVINRITKNDSNVSLYGKKDLAAAVTYSLSHAGVGDTITDTYRYFGSVAQHTASEATEQTMKRTVRQVAPHTLGINLGKVACDRPVPVEDGEDTTRYLPKGQSADNTSGGSSAPSQSDTANTQTERCGGRLVPMEYADDFVENVEYDDDLKRAIRDLEIATQSAPGD